MSNVARHLVSQKKIRTVDRSVPSGSVDLDLTQIHEHIVCMGYPATGMEALYRNRYEDCLRYLDHKYGENYMVYNLCGEKSYQYSLDRFHGRVRCFPFLDHHACPLALMPAFVKDACDWINGGSERVVVIHCKAGKGRTGIMACCLLLAIENPLNGSAAAAMAYYGCRRTEDGRGLTVPSQRRSVTYYERLRNSFGGEVPTKIATIRINEIRLVRFAPRVSVHRLYFSIGDKSWSLRLKSIKKDETPVKATSTYKVTEAGVREDIVALDCRADQRFHSFCGDLKITIRDGNGTAGVLSVNTLFFHSRYESSGIDGLSKKLKTDEPCFIEFDFDVTDGTRLDTPALSPVPDGPLAYPNSSSQESQSSSEHFDDELSQ